MDNQSTLNCTIFEKKLILACSLLFCLQYVLSYILVVLVGDVAVVDSVVGCVFFSVLISALFVNDLVVLTWVDDCTLLLNSFP